MSEPKAQNAPDWFDALQQAMLALETAENGSSVKGAPWWTPLMEALESTQTASREIGIAVLSLLSQTLLETLRPLREGVVDLSPATMKLQARALRKWESLRDALASTPADDEVSTLLQSLGSEKKEKAARSAAGRSTLLIADMSKYLPLFVEETEEALETMQSHLLALEEDAKAGRIPPQNTIDELFRHAHKIKASAGAMGFAALSEMTHTMETVLDRIRSFQLRATPEIVSTLLGALDHLRAEVEVAKQGQVPTAELLEVKASLLWYLDALPSPAADTGMARAIDTAAVPAEHPAEHSLSETALETIHNAIEEGQSAFRIILHVSAQSPLPEMRLFLATTRAKALGAIIAPSVPVEEIEKQPGLASLNFVLISKENEDKIGLMLRDEELDALTVEPLRGKNALPEPSTVANAPTSVQNIRVPVSRLDDLMNLSGELSISKNNFLAVSQNYRAWLSLNRSRNSQAEKTLVALEDAIHQLSQLAGGIQSTVLELRMVPISPLFERCRRVVRDIAQDLGKEVELVLEGADTSLDKKIIDQLGDPLNHMIRNALDHGLETPAERMAAGKPTCGTLTLKAERQGSRICVTIADDGRGISLDAVRIKAVQEGLATIEAADKMSPAELYPFLFAPGFSTARTVTSISGRGVGMDIVRKRIEEINGTILVDSTYGKGTQFRITLPLTVVSQNCLLFDTHGVTFAFPLHNVAEIVRVKPADLMDMQFGKFLNLRDELIAVFRIKHFFRNTTFAPSSTDANELNVIIVKAGKRRIGLIVDEMRGEEEILVKSAGALVGEIPGLAGVSVLSSGAVALILDVEKLVERTTKELGEAGTGPLEASNG